MKKILLIVTILFFVSCSEENENIEAVNNDFLGTWNLTTLNIETSSKISSGSFSYNFGGITYGKDFDFTFTFSENPNEYTTNGDYTLVSEYENPFSGETETSENNVNSLDSFNSGSWDVQDNKFIFNNDELQEQIIDLNLTDIESDLSAITVKSISSNKIILEEKIKENNTETIEGESYSYEVDIIYTIILEK